MKKTVNNTQDAFVKSMNKGLRKRKITGIAIGAVVVILVVVAVVVGLQLKAANKISAAKNTIAQLDINTTFKAAEFKDDGDWDNDGVKNSEETQLGTNLQNEDTDGDGISDGDEVKLGTDPNNADTDGDGMIDGYELMAGTDPKKASTDGKTKDGDRELTVTKSQGDVTLKLTGNANIADTTIDELELFGISSNASVVSKAYDVYSDYDFKTAQMTFKLDKDKISKMNYSDNELSILRFDVDSQSYTKVESKVSADSISADIMQLGTYVVGVEKTVNEKATTRVCFLIDNSGSLYPVEQCETSSENDVDFKRLDFAKSLIDKFDNDFQIGISKFTGSYSEMVDFTEDRAKLTDALEKIRTEDEIFNGTHSQSALQKCINQFTATSGGKYRNIIVMLTDGQSDEVNPASVSTLISQAKDKNVVVLTVGLGRDIDRDWLQELASGTEGKYYSASDADALEAVYKQIVTTLNYDIVSYDDTDSVSGYALYNTGFDPSKNGFAFKNFRTTTTASVDFGMAVMARDWYLGNFSTSLGELEPSDDSTQKVKAAGYDMSGTEFCKLYDGRKELSAVNSDLFSGIYTNVREYLDYEASGEVLGIKSEFIKDSEAKGWKSVTTKIDSGNLQWSKVNLLSLNIAFYPDRIESGYSKNDAEMAKALYRLNALQWDDDDKVFNLTNGDEGFEKLEKLLSLGVPVVTTVDDTHTVNSIGMIQDSSCHRKYILQVYDNNYPGSTKEIYIEKKPICQLDINSDSTATVKKTEFAYSATYEGKQVGLSFSEVEEH